MNDSSLSLQLTPATEHDLPLILDFVRELAEYEKLAHQVTATVPLLGASLFGPDAVAAAVIARVGDAPAGFALYFFTFSTFLAKPGLYLEDLYVRPAWRKHGIGRALHEEPQVPNYFEPGFPFGDLVLEPGHVFAIEPMVNAGSHDVRVLDDMWTVVTADGRRSAHFEHTVAITDHGPEILTRVPGTH